MRMTNRIKRLADTQGKNPHVLSKETGLTYRIVLGLYNAETIKPTTPIGTLSKLAGALGVQISDLYDIESTVA